MNFITSSNEVISTQYTLILLYACKMQHNKAKVKLWNATDNIDMFKITGHESLN